MYWCRRLSTEFARTASLEDASVHSWGFDTRSGFGQQRPGQEFVGHVLLEVLANNTETLAVVGDLVPVTLDVLEIFGKVAERALEDLAVHFAVHVWLHFNKELVSFGRLFKHVVRGTLNGLHESLDLFRVVLNESLVTNEQNLLAKGKERVSIRKKKRTRHELTEQKQQQPR